MNAHPRTLISTLALAAATLPAAAQPTRLYSNGEFITQQGDGFEGADVSRAQTSVISFSISNTSGSTGLPTRVVDDFVVPAGERWRLTRLRFFSTQSQTSATLSTDFLYSAAVARLTLGDPRDPDGNWSIIGGNFTTNRLLPTSAFINAFRLSASENVLGRSRPIFGVDTNLADLPVIDGGTSGQTFWIEYGAAGDPARTSLASTFPLTPLPVERNGSQFFSGAYQTLPNQLLEAPFEIWGIKGCTLSDVAGPNQSLGLDGTLTADDIIVFLGWYFANDTRADVAGANQSTTPDAQFTADDIIVFLGRYFQGC
ncbi:MAG: hypothetical protein MUE97_04145 [Phycisphaerales bacterium]|jgi:hypothetical protein|nr:hypothetical protein [Phycisphaerales bacterium]